MRLEVMQASIANHVVEHIDETALRLYPCPICGREDSLQQLAAVMAAGATSLESVFCTRCGHRFHRKFPTAQWLGEYYASKYQSDARVLPRRRRRLFSRARARLGRAVRAFRGADAPNRLYEFCDGVLRGGGGYYAKDGSIGKVLEVGCGYGTNLEFLRDSGYDVYGTESSPVRVAACRSRGLNVHLTGVDEFGEVRASAPYDFIYSTHVLEHIIDANAHIAALAAMLREDGYLYVETPHLSGETFIYQSHTIFHVHTFSLRSMQALLVKHGLWPMRFLVDNNLKILARKRSSAALEPAPRHDEAVPLRPGQLPYLSVIARHSPGEFRVRWDHYRVEVQGLDGKSLYAAPIGGMHVMPGPNQHEVMLRSPTRVAPGEEFPVLFDHIKDSRPPVWYKL